MLTVFSILTILFPILVIIGLGIADILAPRLTIRIGDRIIISSWLALFVLGNVLTIAAFTIPLTPAAGVSILCFIFIFSLIRQGVRHHINVIVKNSSIQASVLCISVTLLLSFFSSIPSENIDTGAYHFQFAKWLSQYGVVKGVGLILYPVAISTSWLPLTAPFNHGLLENRCHGIIQGFLFLIFIIHLLFVLHRLLTNKSNRADLFLLLCWMIAWPMTGLIAEMSVNSAVTFAIITAGVLALIFYSSNEDPEKEINNRCEDSLFIAFCFGVSSLKITALPLPFAAILWIIYSRRAKSLFRFRLFLFVALFLLPNAIYSTLTSGYPFFISTAIKFNLAWSFTLQEVQHMVEIVHHYYSCQHSNSCGMNLIDRTLAWAFDSKDCLYLILLNIILFFRIYFIQSRDKSLLWFLGTLGVLVSVFIINKGPSLTYSLGWLTLFPAAYVALSKEKPAKDTVILILAVLLIPRLAATRYNLYFFIFYKLFLTLFIFTSFRIHIPHFLNRIMTPSIFLGLCLIFLTIGRGFDVTLKTYPDFANRIYIPDKIFNIERCNYKKITVNDFTLWKVQQDPSEKLCECWFQELPCSGIHDYVKDVKLRNSDSGISGGFIRGEQDSVN